MSKYNTHSYNYSQLLNIPECILYIITHNTFLCPLLLFWCLSLYISTSNDLNSTTLIKRKWKGYINVTAFLKIYMLSLCERAQLCEHLDWVSIVTRNISIWETVFLAIASWHRGGLKMCEESPSPNHTFTHALPQFFFSPE